MVSRLVDGFGSGRSEHSRGFATETNIAERKADCKAITSARLLPITLGVAA